MVTCTQKELENLVAAASKCPSLKAAILTVPLSDHHRHLARKGGESDTSVGGGCEA